MSRGDGDDDAHRERHVRVARRAQELVERDPVHVLLHQDDLGAGVDHVEHRDHVGVVHLGGDARLVEEHGQEVGVLGELRVQPLDGHHPAEPLRAEEARQVDGGHAPARDGRVQDVTTDDGLRGALAHGPSSLLEELERGANEVERPARAPATRAGVEMPSSHRSLRVCRGLGLSNGKRAEPGRVPASLRTSKGWASPIHVRWLTRRDVRAEDRGAAHQARSPIPRPRRRAPSPGTPAPARAAGEHDAGPADEEAVNPRNPAPATGIAGAAARGRCSDRRLPGSAPRARSVKSLEHVSRGRMSPPSPRAGADAGSRTTGLRCRRAAGARGGDEAREPLSATPGGDARTRLVLIYQRCS